MKFAIPVIQRPHHMFICLSLKTAKIYEEEDPPVLPPLEILVSS